VGFPAITEAWNGAVFASGFGASGSIPAVVMTLLDVHALFLRAGLI
jgi:hypothetical protein